MSKAERQIKKLNEELDWVIDRINRMHSTGLGTQKDVSINNRKLAKIQSGLAQLKGGI